MINLKLNGQRMDLKGTEEIACSYSIAPFGNISSRSSTRSINFNIPATANNLAILESVNIVVNNSVIPYSLIPASIDVDGIDQQIEFASISGYDGDISIVLYGSNIDFFSIIKEKELSELDLSDLDHIWNLANVYGSRNNTEGYIYPIVDNHLDSSQLLFPFNVQFLFPAIFLHTLITRIIDEAGFTASGAILSDANYKNILIHTTTRKLDDSFQNFVKTNSEVSTEVTRGFHTLAVPDLIVNFDNDIYDPLNLVQEYTLNYVNLFGFGTTANGYGYKVRYDGDYIFKVNLIFRFIDYPGTANTSWVRFYKRSGVVNSILTEYIYPQSFGLFNIEYEQQYTLQRDDIVFVVISMQADVDVTIQIGSYFKVIESPNNISFGEETTLAINLPKMKQSELLKDFAQKFGLIIQVDNRNKIVYFKQFQEIADNIPNALDWSDKVDYSEKRKISFSDSAYGQSNICRYSDDNSVEKPDGTDYDLIINNQILKATNNLFESPFAATEQVTRFTTIKINQIKIYEDAGTADEKLNSVEPRMTLLTRQDFSFTYSDGGTNHVITTNVPTTRFIDYSKSFNLGFGNSLIEQSRSMVDLLQNFKIITDLLRINSTDINQLDFFIPVWIKRNNEPGAYYYISEISQFKYTDNESTEVELVKLA